MSSRNLFRNTMKVSFVVLYFSAASKIFWSTSLAIQMLAYYTLGATPMAVPINWRKCSMLNSNAVFFTECNNLQHPLIGTESSQILMIYNSFSFKTWVILYLTETLINSQYRSQQSHVKIKNISNLTWFYHLTGSSLWRVLSSLQIKVSVRYKIAHVWEEDESLSNYLIPWKTLYIYYTFNTYICVETFLKSSILYYYSSVSPWGWV